MNLTPIKSRGKGPRKAGFRPPNPKRRKLASEDGDAGDSVYKRSSAAAIEKLPTELLFRILLFSQEHNFPKASLRIGKVLSHPSFYAELVLQAFEPTWDMWMGCVRTRVDSYHGWFEDRQRLGGDPALQSKVIALPFVTIDNVLNAQQMWLKKHGEGRFYQHSGDYNFTDYDQFDERDDDKAMGINDRLTSQNRVPHGIRGYDHMKSAIACFEEEWSFACFDPNNIHGGALGGAETGRMEVHPQIRIPDRLITGPVEKKDVKLLFWLVYSHAVFAEDQSWELTLQGVKNVFAQDDAEIANVASTLLYVAGGFKELPEGVAPVSVDTACQKLVAHQNDGEPCHRKCTWKSIVDRLFDLVDKSQDLAVAYMAKYNLGLYEKTRSPWRYGPNNELITWQRW